MTLAELRWERERQRAAAANLLTTSQAARRMQVPIHIVKRWGELGLITNRGAGGKGNPALWDWDELRTAPQRRVNLRARGVCTSDDCDRPHFAHGLCALHYRRQRRAAGLHPTSAPPTPSQGAEHRLRRGGTLSPPGTLPYRVLAISCPDCGMLRTTPDHLLRKDAGPLPACPRCRVARVMRNRHARQLVDDEFRRKLRRRAYRMRVGVQAKTVESAHNWGKMWTGPELEIAARRDLTARQIAFMLGRTLYAVRHIRLQLRVDPRKIRLAGVSEPR